MNCVGREKSTPKAAAAPSSTSSRKRTRSEQGGVNKHNVSRCKAKRFINNTNHGGVDTSQINPTRSKQNDKNDCTQQLKLHTFTDDMLYKGVRMFVLNIHRRSNR